jgi:hypothetical protein
MYADRRLKPAVMMGRMGLKLCELRWGWFARITAKQCRFPKEHFLFCPAF